MKKVISILLCLCVFSCTSAFAAGSDNHGTITIEEYETAMNVAAAKYGITCTILGYDSDIVLTEDMLKNAIKDLDTFAQSIRVEDVTPAETFPNTDTDHGVRKAMSVKKNVSKSFLISTAYGTANMRAEANVTVNVQNSNVMAINSAKAYQSGAFMNFDSGATTSIGKALNKPSNGWITLTVKGRATFSYADPATSIKTGYTANVTKTVQIDCN